MWESRIIYLKDDGKLGKDLLKAEQHNNLETETAQAQAPDNKGRIQAGTNTAVTNTLNESDTGSAENPESNTNFLEDPTIIEQIGHTLYLLRQEAKEGGKAAFELYAQFHSLKIRLENLDTDLLMNGSPEEIASYVQSLVLEFETLVRKTQAVVDLSQKGLLKEHLPESVIEALGSVSNLLESTADYLAQAQSDQAREFLVNSFSRLGLITMITQQIEDGYERYRNGESIRDIISSKVDGVLGRNKVSAQAA